MGRLGTSLASLVAYSKFHERSSHARNVGHDVVSAAPSARNVCASEYPVACKGSKVRKPLDSGLLRFSENPSPGKIPTRLLGQTYTRMNYGDVVREIAQESFRCDIANRD